MPELKLAEVERYLSGLLHKAVVVHGLNRLGASPAETDVKGYGYGTPLRVDFEPEGEARRSAVLHTMSPGPFGHEHMSDRAQILLWSHRAFNRLPRHVASLDAAGFEPDGSLISLGQVEELCLWTEYVEGTEYAADLERLRDRGEFTDLDFARADALCDYLVEIHRVPVNEPALYTRRIRELIGHSECIMGLSDSYPPHPLVTPELLEQIERTCVGWRWRIKNRTHRLRQVHGDFHPWNILFRDGTDFTVLDRSRGEFGDPADDVISITLNYFFFSLQRSGRLDGDFEKLFARFWDRYLDASGDREILEVVPPFIAFRGLVMASPLWYPALPDSVRRKIVRLIQAVLEAPVFDPAQMNRYCGS
jgi:hypothetical protein